MCCVCNETMMRGINHIELLLLVCIIAVVIDLSSGQLNENDRVKQYHARNHKWPPLPSEYIPNNPRWRTTFERRFEQTARIVDEGDKIYKCNAYLSVLHSALLAPNFTEYGWALTRAPPELVGSAVQALLDNLLRGIESRDTPEEVFEHPVDTEYPLEVPLMVPNGELNRRAMEDMVGCQVESQ